jgi:hypothetical protein
VAEPGSYPGTLLAVDSALLQPGVALFLNGELFAAARVKIPRSYADYAVGRRCSKVGELIEEWYWAALRSVNERYMHQPTGIVIEWPKVYDPREARRRGQSHIDPKSLIPLAGVGENVVGRLGRTSEIWSPEPAEWIGQVPKTKKGDPLASPRGARLWPLLSDAERSRVADGLTHDALDAIGLGLHALQRLPPPGSMRGRVLPGAT